jgi:drug/metabolite transporter (DMT)-like permease
MASGHGGGCGLAELIVFILAVIFGTACSLTSKIMLSMQSEGLTGEMEAFSFPLFQTFSMFVGMLASLPMHWAVLRFKIPFPGYAHENEEGKYIAINGDEVEKPKQMGWHVYFALLIPSLFDLVATALAMFGLKHVDVSIYQMLRGGAIVFVALLKQFMLGDKLKKFMWVGVFWNVMSIVLVGITAWLAATYGSTGTSNR